MIMKKLQAISYYFSMVFGAVVWLYCAFLLYTVSIWWVIIGVILGGVGVVPVAIVLSIINIGNGGFGALLNIFVGLVIFFTTRHYGLKYYLESL